MPEDIHFALQCLLNCVFTQPFFTLVARSYHLNCCVCLTESRDFFEITVLPRGKNL